MKNALALAPVDVQVLGQEGRDDHPRAVVHPAARDELPHAGVDDGIAGAALLPGREQLVVVVPVGLGPLDGTEELDVGVEVAPGELAAGRRRASRDALLEAQRGEAAEVQVLAHPRGLARTGCCGSRRSRRTRAHPGVERLERGRLAGLGPVLELRRLRRSRAPRATGCRRSGRCSARGSRDGRVVDRAARLLAPGAAERRVDLERRAALGLEVPEAGDEVARARGAGRPARPRAGRGRGRTAVTSPAA